MERSARIEGIVLRSVDIGDADKFCIFFTKERGRMTARAKGVRKSASRMAAALQPMQRSALEVHMGSAGATLTSARPIDDRSDDASLPRFLASQQAAELLLAFTQDDDPLPEVYDLLTQFLAAKHCPLLESEQPRSRRPDALWLAFQLRLLALLGLLPAHGDDPRFEKLPPTIQSLIRLCGTTTNLEQLCAHLQSPTPELMIFATSVIDAQLSGPLKAERVAREMS
jgi:recombinational DNA repair protein (RecF pathway)